MNLSFPLRWPLGWPRTRPEDRKPSQFRATGKNGWKRPPTFEEGRKRVVAQLGAYTRVGQNYRVDEQGVQITSDLPLTHAGRPAAGRRDPDDVGVCVYFTLDGVPYALPCDKWATLGENLCAVAANIEAMRGIERWGVGTSKEHFAGFKALPAQGQSSTGRSAWWIVLGVGTPDDVSGVAHLKALYRKRVQETHPDKPGGSDERFVAVTDAYREGLAFFGEAQ